MNKYNGNKEFKIDIPKSVKLIIDILEKNGYEAFAVGLILKVSIKCWNNLEKIEE